MTRELWCGVVKALTTSVAVLLLIAAEPAACQAVPDAAAARLPAESLTVQQDWVLGPGDFDLRDPAGGLGTLTSYRATLNVSFDGVRNGQAEHWTRRYVLQSAREPATYQVNIDKTGDLADTDAVFAAELDEVVYQRRASKACTARARSATVPRQSTRAGGIVERSTGPHDGWHRHHQLRRDAPLQLRPARARPERDRPIGR